MIQPVTENTHYNKMGFFVKKEKKNGFVAKISDFVDKRISKEIFRRRVSSPDFVTGGAWLRKIT